MEVTVRGRNVEVPASVRRVALEKVSKFERLLNGLDHADVCISEHRNRRTADREMCEIILHGNGHVIRAKASAAEMAVALERAIEKLEHQVQKAKARRPRRGLIRRGEPVASTTQHGGDEDDEDTTTGPRIVRTGQFSIKPMTPEEAALQLDLHGHTFVFFNNAETLRPAVVYKRDDGQVGLIDSQ